MGKVTVWHMTEEERLAYIEKHPIKPNVDEFKQRNMSTEKWKWRGKEIAKRRKKKI